MECRIIDRAHRADINLANEPFPLFGRMIPALKNGEWTYTVQLFSEEERSEMCFPDEDYDFDAMAADHVFVGAYDGEKCVGLAVLKQDMFKYLCLDDLKVCRAYRRQGVGRMLVEASLAAAREKGCIGLYAVGQDNNLAACTFYLKNGFEIGGFDNRVYRGTRQQDKANILFYRDC